MAGKKARNSQMARDHEKHRRNIGGKPNSLVEIRLMVLVIHTCCWQSLIFNFVNQIERYGMCQSWNINFAIKQTANPQS